MKVLMVNKFLYPNGGSETYIFELGKELIKTGHEVQYFGMEHEGRIVSNDVNSYTANMDFHTGKMQKLLYPFRIIYSFEARKKIRAVLEDFHPDVVHFNNINFQITPSIIDEIRKYRKENNRQIKIVATMHDYQWICPNHMLYIPHKGKICTSCLGGHYYNCTKHKCIHDSLLKSLVGSFEAYFYKVKKTYGFVDSIICPSEFIAKKLSSNKILRDKLIIRHNFIMKKEREADFSKLQKKDYVLYFGRYSKEKGIETLLKVCKSLPDIPFVFAGSGPLENEVNKIANIRNMGFQKGEKLQKIISEANFSIYPSEWFDNCPFSVMESQMYGTPVIGADIGGIPELIQNQKTGILFDSGHYMMLKKIISELWEDQEKQKMMVRNCENIEFQTVEEYTEDLVKNIYK